MSATKPGNCRPFAHATRDEDVRRLLVLLAVVGLTGCGGLGGVPVDDGSANEPAVSTPAPVPTDRPARYPPGLRASGVNATALAATQERALHGGGYVWQFDRREARPEPGLGAVYVGPRVRVESADIGRYSVVWTQRTERGGGLAVERPRSARFVAGDRVYLRDDNGTRARNVTENDTGYGARLAAGYVARYLAVENVTVRPFENGSALVEGTRSPAVGGTDYDVTAFVTADGVVRWFDAVYVRDDRVQFARFELTRERRTVTPPPYVQNRSD